MGTVTVAVDKDGYSPMDGSNAGWWVRAKITMSNSYATGGDTLTGALFGLGTVTKLEVAAGNVSGGTTAYLFGPVYDSTGVNVTKIQAFWSSASGSAFSEVTNGTNLSTIVVDAEVYGT